MSNKKIYLIDESYNASPQTMKTCVNYFIDLKTNFNQKKIIILGEMKELGDNAIDFHIDLINYISEKNIENVIICGKLMQIALSKTLNKNILCKFDSESVLNYIEKIVKDNDIVLIKGSNSSPTNDLAKKILKKRVN